MSDTEQMIKQHNEECEVSKARLKINGPWVKEQNRLNWKHAGLDCMIVRAPGLLHLCAYVGIPPSHPFYGKEYDDPGLDNVSVHGGLTYANTCPGNICHDGDDKRWWFGFDCAHSGDFVPEFRLGRAETYKTIDWVKAETNSLAEQLAAMNKNVDVEIGAASHSQRG